MKQASSLKELQKIRLHNRDYLNSIGGMLGTALGYKKRTNVHYSSSDPAIIVFVRNKIMKKWLPNGQEVKDKVEIPGEFWCYIDIVEGNKSNDIQPENKLNPITEILRGWDHSIWMGGKIGRWEYNQYGNKLGPILGSIGAFAKSRITGKLGIITNAHVATRKIGTQMYYPDVDGIPFANTITSHKFTDDQEWYQDIDEPNSKVRIDCAFAELTDLINPNDIKNEILSQGPIGEVIDVDLETMNIIGQKVLRIGQYLGIRYGTIVAFGYEHRNINGNITYSDFLIIR